MVFTLGIIFILGKECQKNAVTAICLLCCALFWKCTSVQIMFAAAEEEFAYTV
jgi:hypothetical protein